MALLPQQAFFILTGSHALRSLGVWARSCNTLLSLSAAGAIMLGSPLLADEDPTLIGPAPVTVEQVVAQAYAQVEAGRSADAVKLFKEALGLNADYLPAKLGLAVTYSEQARHLEAFQIFDQVTQSQPDNAYAWNGRGIASFNLERFEEAVASLERSIVDQPVNGFFYESLAWTYMCLGDFRQALDTAKIATLMYDKKSESAAYPLLIAYFSGLETGDSASAKRALDYALRNKPPLNPWPHPVFDFLSDKIDQVELISLVSNTAEETEAHAYIGLKSRARGEAAIASKHLDWVATKGDPRVFEYTLARVLRSDGRVASLTH